MEAWVGGRVGVRFGGRGELRVGERRRGKGGGLLLGRDFGRVIGMVMRWIVEVSCIGMRTWMGDKASGIRNCYRIP